MTTKPKKSENGSVIKEEQSVERAEALWQTARQSLLNFQGTMITIIQERAWEPLGYESFHAAWSDRLADIPVAGELRAHVVYQMLSEGLKPEQIIECVNGVGVEVAAVLARQRQNGIPPELASTTLARSGSSRLSYATIFLKVSRAELRKWKGVAAANEMSVEEIAVAAVADAFEMLAGNNLGAA